MAKAIEARPAVVAADAAAPDPVVPDDVAGPLCGFVPLDELGTFDEPELLEVLGLFDGVVPAADEVGGRLAFTLMFCGVAAAASVWAATVVAAGATAVATCAGELLVDASSGARGSEAEPLAPTAACGARLEPMSAASTRLEWSADRAVTARAPGVTVPIVIGLARDAASAAGSEVWPSPLTEPWVTEVDGVLASTTLGCGGVKSARIISGFLPAAGFDETSPVDRDPNSPASIPTPKDAALPQ